MRARDLIEAPITDYQTIGDMDKSTSFDDPRDRILLTNPQAVKKTHDVFKKTKHNFKFYFINLPEADKLLEVGMVTRDWMKKFMPIIEKQIPETENAITVIFTSNKGDAAVPITSWIIAHRVGHALFAFLMTNFGFERLDPGLPYTKDKYGKLANILLQHSFNILNKVYNITNLTLKNMNYSIAQLEHGKEARTLKAFWNAIGTTRASRNNMLRAHYEFYYEIFAQYLLTGDIRFNPLPEKIEEINATMKANIKPEELEYYNNKLNIMAEQSKRRFDKILDTAVGNYFVM